MARKMPEKRPEEDNRYHDTWKLLKKYRDVTWSLEVSVRQVKNQFRIDYDCSIEDFLDSIYMAGADLGGTIIEDHAKCIERSYKMLTLLENAVNLLRTRHKNGEVYYWILGEAGWHSTLVSRTPGPADYYQAHHVAWRSLFGKLMPIPLTPQPCWGVGCE